ncbi:unnamed protein product [Rotaria magnacalcarata]|uniref:Uncharacterized protein n=2 Tax=Rotaria magnacalcarata TaxID=392030 RepID=A0A816PJK9_9BILA|nr:unnamed protein product [Rotaria magnacalcarata]CAF1322631.1 unnamed protein product [Rotaria magnacalcarata]CAF1922945.1 unnamed protein product [Rotaria magnacalcarata]CAF2049297.1 unnamed protein product [Rotaria magnacalcarata]CAF2199282.1 unnamed protein product [Rotaria magnacalcarata]
MVLHGKDKALEQIPKSSIAFIGKISNVQRGISSVTMPPRDHYKLQFDRRDLRTLRGRVYDTMIDFDYSQIGEGILPATNDIFCGIRKAQIQIPTAGHIYVACLNDNTKQINYLIAVNRFEADDIVRRLNVTPSTTMKK